MWERIVNTTWCNTRAFSLHRTIIHTYKCTKRKSLSEKSQKLIITKGLQYKQIYVQKHNSSSGYNSSTSPKVNSVHFDDLYDHINHMENTHEYTHIIETKEQYMELLNLKKNNSMKTQIVT